MTTPYTLPYPDFRIADTEERGLVLAVQLKTELVRTLHLVAEARRVRGAEDLGILESIELEESILAGYNRALAYRRKQLATARRTSEPEAVR